MTGNKFTEAVCTAIQEFADEHKADHPQDVMAAILTAVEGMYALVSALPTGAWNVTYRTTT